jgi:hypothetical protein
VHDAAELIAAYDGTAPYCMTLQQFIDFDKYVRCFTFGKTDIVPVVYDPHQRRYLVEHGRARHRSRPDRPAAADLAALGRDARNWRRPGGMSRRATIR